MKRPVADKAQHPVSDKAQRGPQPDWTCPRCAHRNSPKLGHCSACRLRRPTRTDPARGRAP